MVYPTLIVALLAVFAAVAMIAGSVTYFTLERSALSPIRRRLQAAARPVAKGLDGDMALTSSDERPTKLSSFVPVSPKTLGKLRRRLALAGLHKPSHAVTYSICEMAFPVVGFLVPTIILGFSRGMIYAILGAII